MERKITKLESKVLDLGFKLRDKVYTGRHRSRVESYNYVRNNGEIEWIVTLNRERNKVEYYSFTENRVIRDYDFVTIERLAKILKDFDEEMATIYDFANDEVKE